MKLTQLFKPIHDNLVLYKMSQINTNTTTNWQEFVAYIK